VMHKSARLAPLVIVVALALPATDHPSTALAASRTAIEFFARTPHGNASCAIYDGYGGSAEAFCESYRPGRESKATVNAKGKVSICASHNTRTNDCGLGNAGLNTPTFGYGHRITVGRFRCAVLHSGVMCTTISSGKGFLFNPNRAVQVGPASKQG
jgi:hypothetical protein